MARHILIEEFHLTVMAPRDLSPTEFDTMRQTLTSRKFINRLRHAARRVFGREPSLSRAKVRLSR